MATAADFDKKSRSVQSPDAPETQVDPEQDGGSLAEMGVSDASMARSPEDTSDYGRGSTMVKGSRMEYHLRAVAEIEEHTSEGIVISPDLRESLPPAVEKLLCRLESPLSDDPLRELKREDLRGPGFGTLFGGSKDRDFDEKFGHMPREWATGVRLLIMTAAGRCETLELVDLRDLSLTLQELKAVLDPLRSSVVIRELDVSGNEILETKEGCEVVADFLKCNSSLRVLSGSTLKYSIGYYLATHGHPTLEEIRWLDLNTEDTVGIMRAYPKLKRMPGNTWNVEDEHTAKMYAQALLEHESFCELDVCGPAGPVSSLLLSVCTGARPTTSLTSLRLSITGEDRWLQRGDLHPLILANKNLEVIMLRNVYTFSEEWQGAFRSLRQNAALKRLS